MGNSGSNFLLKDNTTFDTQAFTDLTNGKHFEKVKGNGEKLADGTDNHCTSTDIDGVLAGTAGAQCDGFTEFQTLVNKVYTVEETGINENNLEEIVEKVLGQSYITAATFEEHLKKFAPEAANKGPDGLMNAFVTKLKNQFESVDTRVKRVEDEDRTIACDNATCLERIDVNDWLTSDTHKEQSSKFKAAIRTDVLNYSGLHE